MEPFRDDQIVLIFNRALAKHNKRRETWTEEQIAQAHKDKKRDKVGQAIFDLVSILDSLSCETSYSRETSYDTRELREQLVAIRHRIYDLLDQTD